MSQPTMTARPATWSGTSGPILYKLTSTNYAEAGYYMAVEVWNSTTAAKIADAKYYANSSGAVTVDVSAFLKSAMSLDNTADLTTSDVVYTDGNWVKYYIKYREYWTAGSESQVDDVANFRYAIYGGLQLGNVNDFTGYTVAPFKMLSSTGDLTSIVGRPFVLSFLNQNGIKSIVRRSRYLKNVLLETVLSPIGGDSVGALYTTFTEDSTSDKSEVVVTEQTLSSTLRTAGNRTWIGSAFGNGIHVMIDIGSAGGTTGKIQTSPDGITWTARTAPDNIWNGIAFGNGTFVVVGGTSGVSNQVITSTDGITWTSRSSYADKNWKAVAFGNDIFVAVAYDGSAMFSLDNGETWNYAMSALPNQLRSITYGNGFFVAGGNNDTDTTHSIMTSPDGANWTSRLCSSSITGGIAYGMGIFLAVGVNKCFTSSDGATWTDTSQSSMSTSISDIEYGGGIFLAAISSGSSGFRLQVTVDGVQWLIVSTPLDRAWSCISYNSTSGLFVVGSASNTDTSSVMTVATSTSVLSETKTINILEDCQNTVMLQWRNSLGGYECYPFTYNQEYTWHYSDRKAKRLTLYADNLTLSQWEAIQGLNTLGDLYRSPITEMTTSLNRTSATIGQSVYVLNSDGSKIGVNVIGQANTTRTKQKTHSAFVTIEYPELFLQ